jgi:tRNA-splicing ligase RtcB
MLEYAALTSTDPADLARQMRGVTWNAARAADLVEEAPSAYRNISTVMRAQRALTRVVRRVTPVLNYKGV